LTVISCNKDTNLESKPAIKYVDSLKATLTIYSGTTRYQEGPGSLSIDTTYPAKINVTYDYKDSIITFLGDGKMTNVYAGVFKMNSQLYYALEPARHTRLHFSFVNDTLKAEYSWHSGGDNGYYTYTFNGLK
jgi:hypothetical protein